RQLDLVGDGSLRTRLAVWEFAAIELDGQGDRRLVRGVLERRGLHGEREAALRNRARQGSQQRRRGSFSVGTPRVACRARLFVALALFGCASSRRGIALTGDDAQVRTLHPHFD